MFKKRIVKCIVLAVLFVAIVQAGLPLVRAQQPLPNILGFRNYPIQPETEFKPNEMIVGFENINSNVLLDIEKSGGVILEQIPTLSAVRVYVPSEMEDAFIKAMYNKPEVRYVERNGIFKAVHTPNDPYWGDQWGMRIIQADTAWDVHKGSASVTVAIIDTGIEYTHDDLSGHYSALGYDWVNNDNDPMDDNGHGTHCAGIAAAEMDNAIGVVGVAQVSLIAEKVLNVYAYGYVDDVAQGITHAADVGANVISVSLGSYEDFSIVKDACQYAWDKGCILVGAAGNDNRHYPWMYPAAYFTVIAVSATDRNDAKASYSNYGLHIELSAPGGDGTDYHDWILSSYLDNGYAWAYGTSMAAPHVSGVAALVWSYENNITNQQLRERLRNTADDLGDEGFDPYYGYGRINAYRALYELERMHVGDISMWYEKRYRVYTRVPILDENGQAVPDATVYLDTTLPDGSVESFIETTGSDGMVTFGVKSKLTGTYTSTVTDVVKEMWIYKPASNVETSESLTVP